MKTAQDFCKMISHILFTKICRIKLGLAFCYAISLVIFLVGVRIQYFRRSFDADDKASDARRFAEWRRRLSRQTCHMSRKDDVLELLRSNATLPENSIFFHETTCKGDLTARQACVVESAAKAHPNHQINVFFTSAVTEATLNDGCVSSVVNNYGNVKLSRVLIKDYAEGSPLASSIERMTSEDLNIHMSKIMKYLTMYKYSGIYLSMDVIVARKFDLLPNWAVKDSPNTLSSDMFAFSKNKTGRKLAKYALSFLLTELKVGASPDTWSYSRPSVISKLLAFWCSARAVEDMELSKCNDLAVYNAELFYPISFHDRKQYFLKVDWNNWKKRLIYTYFVWHRFTRYNIITPESLYGKIAYEYCPITYLRFSDESKNIEGNHHEETGVSLNQNSKTWDIDQHVLGHVVDYGLFRLTKRNPVSQRWLKVTL